MVVVRGGGWLLVGEAGSVRSMMESRGGGMLACVFEVVDGGFGSG